MTNYSKSPRHLAMVAACALAAPSAASAQDYSADEGEVLTVVTGSVPDDLSGLTEGPTIEGIITARNDDRIQVTNAAGTPFPITFAPVTKIVGTGGFLGTGNQQLSMDSLLNGIPVKVQTVNFGRQLVAKEIRFKNKDLKTATMIANATNQRFTEQGEKITANTKAADALRSRLGDIDNYNIKGTTNVYFDTGKWNLTTGAEMDLCSAAAEADTMDNALLLVVGYTDSVGNQDYNQVLSERRASRVVNHLQQACGWKPWRMLTPTGMAESDPLASNDTEAGRAQNRRVSVNILVSKSVDGI